MAGELNISLTDFNDVVIITKKGDSDHMAISVTLAIKMTLLTNGDSTFQSSFL